MAVEPEERSTSKGSAGAVLLGTLVGLGIGVAAGLLLAPKSGKQTREELQQRLDELKAQTAQVQATMQEKIEDLIQRAAECSKSEAETSTQAPEVGQQEQAEEER